MFFVNIFTYSGDEDIILYSALSAQLVFKNDCEVNVIDDANHPINKNIIKELEKNNIKYRQSTFNRGRNLNGKECCIGILKNIIQSANNQSGVSIKLDSDTLIFKRDLFDNFAVSDDIKYMASNRPGGIYSGICYAIKNDILDKMLKNLINLDIDDIKAPEDITLGCIATLSAFPYSNYVIPAWESNEQAGVFSGWSYLNKNVSESFLYYINKFVVCTAGNWYLYPNITKKDRFLVMNGLYTELLNLTK